MPLSSEVHQVRTHIWRTVKAGLPTVCALIGALIVVVGGSVAITVRWGATHLAWGIVLILAVLLVVILIGSYRLARDAEEGHKTALAAALSPGIDPGDWEATCSESEDHALSFMLSHRLENRGAYQRFGLLRCTVTDPGSAVSAATSPARFAQYLPCYFSSAPPVRSGTYRFTWEGQEEKGAWHKIKAGEHEVKVTDSP